MLRGEVFVRDGQIQNVLTLKVAGFGYVPVQRKQADFVV